MLFTKLAVAVLVSAFHISPADDAKVSRHYLDSRVKYKQYLSRSPSMIDKHNKKQHCCYSESQEILRLEIFTRDGSDKLIKTKNSLVTRTELEILLTQAKHAMK